MLTLSATAKGRPPKIPFSEIAKNVLGFEYALSLVFCGDYLSRRLNRAYLKKDRPTNILSFPLNKKEGELFLNLAKARREAKLVGLSLTVWVAYLFIHGMLHLKGFEHGSTMEEAERKTLLRFGFLKDPKAKSYFSS